MCVCLTRGALAVQFVRRAHFRFELFLDAKNLSNFGKALSTNRHRHATMDFTSTANANGPADPNNIMLRGADPLFSLPAAHPLRRAGLNQSSSDTWRPQRFLRQRQII